MIPRNFFNRTGKFIFIICLFFLHFYVSNAQDSIQITGMVLSGYHKPMPNVSVSIEGSYQMPVVTNDNGEFTIKVANINEWLVVSPASGYKVKRVFLGKRDDITVVLTALDLFAGDDQVTILNQPVNRKNIISSYSELKKQKVIKSNALSVDQIMQGVVPGMNVISNSGMPGSGSFINVRGINSINASCQPMVIVDGIPAVPQGIFNSNLAGYDFNQLATYNPSDISKVTVVKDPLLNASFGTNGSNGIIFIETLDPQVTQTTIDFDFKSGLSLAPTQFIPQLDASQHKTYMQEILFSSPLLEEDIKTAYPSLFYTSADEGYINYQHNTNWQSLIFNDSRFNTFNISIKGGDEIARYGLSFGYTTNKGIIKNTEYSGYNLRFVSKVNVFRWLKMNAGVSLNVDDAKLREAAVVTETSPILASLSKSPLLNPYQYDIDGNEITALAEVDYIGVSNPMAIIDNYSAYNHHVGFVASADFESAFNKYLSLKTKLSLTYNILKEALFMPNHGMERYYNNEAYNVSKASNNDIQTFYNNTYLYFKKSFGNNHFFTSNTGANLQTNNYQFDFGVAKNANENDKFRELQDGQDNLREIGGRNRDWNWLSFYENVFYSFKDKYLFSASASLDMSSRLGKNADNTVKVNGVPFGFFYSGGLAWRLSNEIYLNELHWLDDLKLRMSYGKTGNSDIGESSATNYYKAIKFRETVGLYPYVLPNDKLTYETVSQLNFGADISLWGNRFTTNFDLFRSKTDNMLILSPVESYLGYNVQAENGGELSNKGWESNTFLRVIDKQTFKWDVVFTLSKVINEITSIKGNKLITPIDGAELVNMEGAPVNSFYGYVFKGVFADQTQAGSANLKNNKGVAFRAGDAIFEDISGPGGVPDNIINEYDKTAIGSALPEFFGGIANTFTYKRWSLSTFIQFVKGNDVFNYVRYKNEQMTDLRNQSQVALNRWQYEGQQTNIPRALWGDPIGNSAFSTRWIEDGSYIRLKTITLSYTIPDKFLIIRDACFYISVTNLFTKTNYLGYDPEFAYSYSQRYQGIDYGLTPQPRQFIVGVKIGL